MSETPQDQPYKDDTSDGTTAVQAQAEANVDQVKSTDDIAREAAGIDHPVEGHDVRDYRPPTDPEPDATPQAPENVGDDEAVDEHGDDVDTADDAAPADQS